MRLVSMIVAALGGLSLSLSGLAVPASAAPAGTANVPTQASSRPLERADLEDWLDALVPYALARADIAGAVIVVVKDGQILSKKGFGYSNVAKKLPVDPDRTMFRVGSSAKLFTWTAVMQLVEQGKLSLDRDVNQYLDFKIPKRSDGPITLRHIMTHTPGFEEPQKNLFTNPDIMTLEAYLKGWVPERVFPAGRIPGYSNYATALAGYIVQRVSGETYEDYVENHIFRPLGMNYTSARQPLPGRLKPFMSQGYETASGPPAPYELAGPGPAGIAAATGTDMARFMIAHLQGGQLGSARILRPETVRIMHTPASTVLPRVNRMALGFYEANRNGRRIIGHGGDTRYFHTELRLLLDEGVGFFVSMNSSGTDSDHYAFRGALIRMFLDRYFPDAASEGSVDAKTAEKHAMMIAGSYIPSRGSFSNFGSAASFLGSQTVYSNEDGTISVSNIPGGLNDQPKKWREIAPFVWREEGGKDLLSAKVENGKIAMFSVDELSPGMVFLRTSGWRAHSELIGNILTAALAALALTVLLWPVSAFARWHYGAALPLHGREAVAYHAVRAASLATVATFIAWFMALGMLGSEALPATSKSDGVIWTLHILATVVFIGGTVVALGNAWIVWRSRQTLLAKFWSVVLLAACLSVLGAGFAFKLIAFDANY